MDDNFYLLISQFKMFVFLLVCYTYTLYDSHSIIRVEASLYNIYVLFSESLIEPPFRDESNRLLLLRRLFSFLTSHGCSAFHSLDFFSALIKFHNDDKLSLRFTNGMIYVSICFIRRPILRSCLCLVMKKKRKSIKEIKSLLSLKCATFTKQNYLIFFCICIFCVFDLLRVLLFVCVCRFFGVERSRDTFIKILRTTHNKYIFVSLLSFRNGYHLFFFICMRYCFIATSADTGRNR